MISRFTLFLTIGIGILLTVSGFAQTTDQKNTFELWKENPGHIFEVKDIDLSDFLWGARPVVVFAETPADTRFKEQMDLLKAQQPDLIERDVVVITDTDPDAASDLRTRLRPRGFMLVLIGKDGGVKLRKPAPWDVRELSRVIDKMPMRQQEIRERKRFRVE